MASPPFVVLIPARLSSTRLPHKPLADLAGLPMVVRVAQRALASKATQVVVAADHERIVDACQAHGIQALLTLDDHASGSDRLAEAASLRATPVTTRKDFVRIPPEFRAQVTVVSVSLEWQDESEIEGLLAGLARA
jgi:CMP-2-keto-3-deoxyoctulosonic acid synthetase